jgi:hypothetical protein
MVPYEYIYISLIISVVFFILKQFLYRAKPIKDQNKLFFKESFYLFFIILGVKFKTKKLKSLQVNLRFNQFVYV